MAKDSSATSHNKYLIYYGILFIVSLLILSPQIPFLLNKSILKIIVNILLIQSFLLLPLIFFCKKLKVYYFLLALYCSAIPVLFLPFLIVHESLNPEIMNSVFASTFREVYELLGVKLIPLFMCCCLSFYIVLQLTKRFPAAISFKKVMALVIVSVVVFFSILLSTAQNSQNNVAGIFKNELPQFYPFNIFINGFSILKAHRLEKDYLKNTASFTFGAHKINNYHLRTVQVLVIGESSRYDHWAINGYARNTSPYLKAEQNLVSFSNVSTGATFTFQSVPFLITKVGVDHFINHLKEKSVTAAFKEGGFYTAWISNQDGGVKTNFAEFHTADADTTIYTNNTTISEQKFLTKGLYDESVLQPLHSLLQHEKKDLFIVIHLMGNHWDYKLRYPSNFDVFVPQDLNGTKVFDNRTLDEMVCAYDNSILYNDYILHSVITELKATDAFSSMLFISDHGENLDDGNQKQFIHSATPTYYTAHVPLFIWLSDELKTIQPSITDALQMNKNKPISSAESVFYTVLQLGGITIADSVNLQFHSLASNQLVNSSQKIVGDSNNIYLFKNLNRF